MKQDKSNSEKSLAVLSYMKGRVMMEMATISLSAYLKEQVEARLDLWDMTWDEFIENAMNDPFYAEKNQSRIQDSIAQIEEGKVVKKTMAELEAMADG